MSKFATKCTAGDTMGLNPEPKSGGLEGTLYTEQEAATFLHMTPRMLATRRRAGKIRYIKDGHFIIYKVEHFAGYLISLEKGTKLEGYLTDTAQLLEEVKKHLARSSRPRRGVSPDRPE